MKTTISEGSQTYQPFMLPTYEEIKNFMEHGRNDELDVRSYLGLKTLPEDIQDEAVFRATPSPPRYRDLIEILHP